LERPSRADDLAEIPTQNFETKEAELGHLAFCAAPFRLVFLFTDLLTERTRILQAAENKNFIARRHGISKSSSFCDGVFGIWYEKKI
jgi:hypothetical protein